MLEKPSPSDIELVRKKSDAELDTIIDLYQTHADIIFRQAALEERHRRQKDREGKKEKTQSRILLMAVVAVVLSLAALIVAVLK